MGKTKIIYCKKCNKQKEVSKKSRNTFICKNCQEFIECICPFCKNKFKCVHKRKFCSRDCVRRSYITSDKTKKKLSLLRIKSIENGNVGYGIRCNFEGIRCDSALEYAFCKWYKLNHPNAKIKRYKGFIEFEGHKYIPDFLIDDKIIVEVKYNKQLGYNLLKKWKEYQTSQVFKRKALENRNSLWITQSDIGDSFYRQCLREIKQLHS